MQIIQAKMLISPKVSFHPADIEIGISLSIYIYEHSEFIHLVTFSQP